MTAGYRYGGLTTAAAPTFVPPTRYESAQYVRETLLAVPGGPTASGLRLAAEDDPAMLAYALVLDIPRRLVSLARRPLPTWVALVLVWRLR